MSEKHTPYTSAPWTTEGGWIYGRCSNYQGVGAAIRKEPRMPCRQERSLDR